MVVLLLKSPLSGTPQNSLLAYLKDDFPRFLFLMDLISRTFVSSRKINPFLFVEWFVVSEAKQTSGDSTNQFVLDMSSAVQYSNVFYKNKIFNCLSGWSVARVFYLFPCKEQCELKSFVVLVEKKMV